MTQNRWWFPHFTFQWPTRNYWAAWMLATLYNFSYTGFGQHWKTSITFSLAHFVTWALLGMVAMPLMRRFPLYLHWRPWLFHLVVGSLFTQLDTTIVHLIFFAITGQGAGLSLFEVIEVSFKTCFYLGLLTYLGFLGVVQGLDALKLARERKLQLAEHKSALMLAQLQSLKIQLQPHFLFNTLNSIASLMRYDVDTADHRLNRLSELLRISLLSWSVFSCRWHSATAIQPGHSYSVSATSG